MRSTLPGDITTVLDIYVRVWQVTRAVANLPVPGEAAFRLVSLDSIDEDKAVRSELWTTGRNAPVACRSCFWFSNVSLAAAFHVGQGALRGGT